MKSPSVTGRVLLPRAPPARPVHPHTPIRPRRHGGMDSELDTLDAAQTRLADAARRAWRAR
ncbi:hypothetical protein GCM10017600_81580 [Streptosporangium carneum]|uniref:Uncharacterized protein n=1 Tax=Streptosporangium carneum TaxID=47481 RepID=A0A9W6I9T4_9ACTN|nr:hypothetical protein GCM10017600_81580 [Streptosporangium carneum]